MSDWQTHAANTGCYCADQTKPCAYHEGYQDGLDRAEEDDRQARWDDVVREHTCYPDDGPKCPPRCQYQDAKAPSWFS
jgi:hypothetical protein